MTGVEQHDLGGSPISVVLMDWAGTITVPMPEMMRLAAEHLGFSNQQLAQALTALAGYFTTTDSMIHKAERGEVPDSELLAWLESQSPGSQRLFDPNEPSFINAPDRPEMLDLLWWLQDKDVTVIMATNNFASAQEMLASRYLDPGLVSAVINSALIGARKPEQKFWDITLEAAMADPTEVVLLDDNKRNLDSAAEHGMATILVENDAACAIKELKDLLGDG